MRLSLESLSSDFYHRFESDADGVGNGEDRELGVCVFFWFFLVLVALDINEDLREHYDSRPLRVRINRFSSTQRKLRSLRTFFCSGRINRQVVGGPLVGCKFTWIKGSRRAFDKCANVFVWHIGSFFRERASIAGKLSGIKKTITFYTTFWKKTIGRWVLISPVVRRDDCIIPYTIQGNTSNSHDRCFFTCLSRLFYPEYARLIVF